MSKKNIIKYTTFKYPRKTNFKTNKNLIILFIYNASKYNLGFIFFIQNYLLIFKDYITIFSTFLGFKDINTKIRSNIDVIKRKKLIFLKSKI